MKNVLIITYYWPPLAGGGVQRWLKFSKYLPENDWNPIIFTPEDPSFSITDESLVKEVSDELEIIRFPIWEPYSLARKKSKQGVVNDAAKTNWKSRILTWVRGNLIIPDPKVFWVNPSVKFLRHFVKERDIQVVVTTGPPHSMHLIGRKLKKKTGVKWVADFRDPWSNWDMLEELKVSSLALKFHKMFEKKVLETADCVITVSKVWATDFEKDYGRNVEVVTNGFDESDFGQQINDSVSDKFTIIHAGLLNSFRDSSAFWKALKNFSNGKEKIKMILAGIIDDRIRKMLESDEKLCKIIEFREYIPHEELISEYRKSSILLLLTNNTKNQSGHLPGKLFEYLAVKRFILMLGNTGDEASRIIEETNSGYCLSPDDEEGIKNVLEILFEKYLNKEKPDTSDISVYSRKQLTSKLSTILNSL